MDNQSLEERVAQLEKELAFWVGKFKKANEDDSIHFLELELKVENLTERLKDFYRVEKIASDAYVRTHPEVQETLLDMSRIVDMDVMDHYFQNLPTIKDARSRS